MARGTHWWNEPPLWAWVVMVVGAVSLVVLMPIALQRGQAPVEGAQSTPPDPVTTGAATSTPSSSASPTATTAPAEEPASVVVVGDGDSTGEAAWPTLLEQEFENVDVEAAAEAGAGYVTAGTEGNTLPDLAGQVGLEGADVVVVFGSRNDGAGVADDVARAAADVFRVITDAAPDAELLVIGPPWFSEPVPAGVRNNRDVIRTAAEAAGATFVDPLTDGWFADRSELLTETGNPNTEGQAYLARLIEPTVRNLLTG